MNENVSFIAIIIVALCFGLSAGFVLGLVAEAHASGEKVVVVSPTITDSPRYRSTDGVCVNWIERNHILIKSVEGWYNTTSGLIEPSCPTFEGVKK